MSHSDPETSELVRRTGVGDQSAREMLLSRHRDRLRRMVAFRMDRRLVARVDPSDVVQNALAEATRRLPGYLEDQPLPFYPWLRKITWEQLVRIHERHLYAQKRTVAREQGWQPYLPDDSVMELAERVGSVGGSPSAQLMRQELHHRLRASLDRLSSSDREMVLMRYLEHLSIRDIAAELEIQEGAVKARCFRAVRRLHTLLENEPEEQ